jgi:lysozyme
VRIGEGSCRGAITAQGASPGSPCLYRSDEFVWNHVVHRSFVTRTVTMDEIDHQMLLDQLIRMEGLTLYPRRDAAGNLVIGVGRNLERVGLTRGEAVMLLEGDVRRLTRELGERLPSFRMLDAVRQRVVIHLALKMEVDGLMALTPFVSAVESGDWTTAADEMLISQWARREPRRAGVLAEMMRTGRDEPGSEE